MKGEADLKKKRFSEEQIVLARAAFHVGEVARELLQADHIRVGQASRFGGDALRIDAPVHAAAPLHVPAD
jgi:hypothetical protein